MNATTKLLLASFLMATALAIFGRMLTLWIVSFITEHIDDFDYRINGTNRAEMIKRTLDFARTVEGFTFVVWMAAGIIITPMMAFLGSLLKILEWGWKHKATKKVN